MFVDAAPKAATRVDAAGLRALPGLVDLHTHLREPGFEQSETVLTGSRAAAAGGFTAVFAMANTVPVQDSAAVVEQVQALGDRAGYVTVRPIGAVTRRTGGGAAQRDRRDGALQGRGPGVLRRRAVRARSAPDAPGARVRARASAESSHSTRRIRGSPSGAQLNEGELSSRLGLAGWPAVAEESIIARDVLLAQHVGARLHICHVSTAGSVDVLRWAKAKGIDVTAEVTPHHLLLTEELASGYDTRFKVNPPLRRDEDVAALREALADGTIDIVATDHAPHPIEAKECAWDEAANGMVGLESALSVVQAAMVESGLLDWPDVARVLSAEPARIGRLAGYDAPFAAGSPANLTLVDTTRHPHVRRRAPARQGRELAVPRARAARAGRHDRPRRHPDRDRRRPRARRGGRPVNQSQLIVGILIAVLVVGVFLLMLRSWRRRVARQAPLGALATPPAGTAFATLEGLHLGTTFAGRPLDRVAVTPLGFRARGLVLVRPDGVELQLDGAGPVFIPVADLIGARPRDLDDRSGRRGGRAQPHLLATARHIARQLLPDARAGGVRRRRRAVDRRRGAPGDRPTQPCSCSRTVPATAGARMAHGAGPSARSCSQPG